MTVEADDLHSAGRTGRNLTYGLLEALGRAIVVREYDDAVFPTEAMLATRYGVSRSVTREAVKMLTAKGLLTARPRKGTTVQPPEMWNLFDPDVLRWLLERKFSMQLLRQFTELRVAIEPAAAALAASAGDRAAIAAIARGYDRMVAAGDGDDDTLSADVEFHLAVLRAAANPFYAQFQDLVTTALRTSIRFTSDLDNHITSLPQHRAVLTAIEAGDAEAARAAMAVLITDVLVKFVEAEPNL